MVLLNYRGSVGFGEASIQSLPGHIGTNDVADCWDSLQAAVEKGECQKHDGMVSRIGLVWQAARGCDPLQAAAEKGGCQGRGGIVPVNTLDLRACARLACSCSHRSADDIAPCYPCISSLNAQIPHTNQRAPAPRQRTHFVLSAVPRSLHT